MQLLQQLQSPVWWFSVVVAGLIVNVAAAFLKTHMDRWLNTRSASRRKRSEREAAAREATIAGLATNPQKQVLYALETSQSLTLVVLLFVVSFGLAGFASSTRLDLTGIVITVFRILTLAMAAIALLLAARLVESAFDRRDLLQEAVKRAPDV